MNSNEEPNFLFNITGLENYNGPYLIDEEPPDYFYLTDLDDSENEESILSHAEMVSNFARLLI